MFTKSPRRRRKKYYNYRYLKRLSANEIKKKSLLAAGYFGEVWLATMAKETVVVKTLKESSTNLEEKQFREEALLLSTFDNEFIVKAMGICLQSRPIMLALEYVNGGSVESCLRKPENRLHILNEKDLLLVIRDASKACAYLEEHGYIHRDLASRYVCVSD